MTNAQQSLPPSRGVQANTEHGSSTSRRQGSSARIERLFEWLSGFYGARMSDLWRGMDIDKVKAIWSAELSGFSNAELAAGVAGCRNKPFAPTLPEFVALCRPPIDYEATFLEVVEQASLRESGRDVWSRPAVFWASTRLGTEIRSLPYSAVKVRWKTELDRAIKAVQSGELPNEVPPHRGALPSPEQVATQSIAESKERIAELAARLAKTRSMRNATSGA